MAFLAKTDLSLSILTEELDEITRGDDTLVTEAIDRATGEVKTYLFDSYDTEQVFAASGTARNSMVMQVVADIAIWRLVAACQAGIDLSDREKRYDAAITWLKMVKKQETYPDLPVRPVTKQVHIRYGSQPKRGNYF